MNKFRWLVITLLIGIMALGIWQIVMADSYSNVVLEITEAGSGARVRQGPGTGYTQIERLLWGDRVLWLGTTTQAEGYTWYEVVLGSGQIGWIAAQSGDTIEAQMFYTTPDVRLGTTVVIAPDGNGSHLRKLPSTYADEVETLRTGDSLAVIDGPYQTEYQLWWKLQLPDGRTGWLIDIPGWMEVGFRG